MIWPMTVEGEQQLREEVAELKNTARPNIVREIAAAREHGDLRENAEYHAAKEQQGFIEARIRDIEAKLADSQVIDITRIRPTGKVVFGATVTLSDCDTDETVRYKIVGEDEADLKFGKISVMSPIARAIIGKSEGDSVMVETPAGDHEYTVERGRAHITLRAAGDVSGALAAASIESSARSLPRLQADPFGDRTWPDGRNQAAAGSLDSSATPMQAGRCHARCSSWSSSTGVSALPARRARGARNGCVSGRLDRIPGTPLPALDWWQWTLRRWRMYPLPPAPDFILGDAGDPRVQEQVAAPHPMRRCRPCLVRYGPQYEWQQGR